MTMNISRVILVVDDEPMITGPLERLIEEILEDNHLDQQYQLITENNPAQALAQLKENHRDVALAISDIMMPQMDGLDFLKAIKSLHPMAPRIVLTGFADKENAIRALNELGLFYYIEKPWDDDWFGTLIVNALEQYRRTRIEALFGRYVPHEIIEEFVNQSDDAILEGQVLEVTILFLDIVDFTRRTEDMDARATVKLLNEYFTEMVDIIRKHRGILDKFTGDGLMALFGVPRPIGKPSADAKNAVLAALDMVESVMQLNARHQKAGLEPVSVRIGLNTGEVVAGNIGSKHRVNYTAVGDVVNTASRIEDAARYFMNGDLGCVLISQNTYNEVEHVLKKEIAFEPQGPVELSGKKDKVELYKVIRR